MNREKQVNEMAQIMWDSLPAYDMTERDCRNAAEAICNADYRKQSEVAREILKEARQAVLSLILSNAMGQNFDIERRFAEIEKKYTGATDTNVGHRTEEEDNHG